MAKKIKGFNPFEMWLCGWASLAQGITTVFSLGFYHPSIALWTAKKIARRQMRIEGK